MSRDAALISELLRQLAPARARLDVRGIGPGKGSVQTKLLAVAIQPAPDLVVREANLESAQLHLDEDVRRRVEADRTALQAQALEGSKPQRDAALRIRRAKDDMASVR